MCSAADSQSRICGQCCYIVHNAKNSSYFVNIQMSSTHSLLIKSVMDTPGAVLTILPQMHDRGYAGNAVILYSI
jgi:hypothetical protein